ncbi:hypothetical protein B0H34DRAFT_65271 [Crassisporium funariophilum]|nr:hypothetical protein B0H34DRAFT_65271 [Crassisporium funariophilum]
MLHLKDIALQEYWHPLPPHTLEPGGLLVFESATVNEKNVTSQIFLNLQFAINLSLTLAFDDAIKVTLEITSGVGRLIRIWPKQTFFRDIASPGATIAFRNTGDGLNILLDGKPVFKRVEILNTQVTYAYYGALGYYNTTHADDKAQIHPFPKLLSIFAYGSSREYQQNRDRPALKDQDPIDGKGDDISKASKATQTENQHLLHDNPISERENDVYLWEKDVLRQGKDIAKRHADIASRERDISERERDLARRETAVAKREDVISGWQNQDGLA